MVSRAFLRYLAMKVSVLVVTYFIAIVLVFVLPRLIPGSPIAVLIARIGQAGQYTPEQLELLERKLVEEFDLDKPWWVQFANYLWRLIHGDLGRSIIYYKPVSELLAETIPWTLALLVPATLVAWYIGNKLGALAGFRRGTLFEKSFITGSLIVSTMPYYWFAMILLYVFAVQLNLFPIGGGYSQGLVPSLTPEFVVDFLWHYTLPFLSIVLVQIGGWAVGMRLLVIYELGSDYMRFSESLGVKKKILFSYAYRNSLLPQITGLALQLGVVLGGQLITEVVFTYPGTGYLLFQALTQKDYPLIQGAFIILVGTLFLANFIVDFVYALVDPRVRLGYSK